jgi:ribonuclease HI
MCTNLFKHNELRRTYIDGAAKGNPGKGGYGVVMESVKWVKPTAKIFTRV